MLNIGLTLAVNVLKDLIFNQLDVSFSFRSLKEDQQILRRMVQKSRNGVNSIRKFRELLVYRLQRLLQCIVMPKSSWLLEFGASRHSTNRRNWLKGFQEESMSIKIAKGDV